jgi:hypothetical protein
MANVTSVAAKRVSNKLLLKTNVGSGSRTSRFVTANANIVRRGINALNVGLFNLVAFPEALATTTELSLVSMVKWLASDPAAAKTQGYPTVLANNSEFAARNRKVKSSLSTGGTIGGNKFTSVSDSQPSAPIMSNPDKTYKWNLPPHKWSLPVDPSSILDTVKSPNKDLHTKRRGIIFVGRKYNGNTIATDAKTGKKENTGTGSYSSNYGFQFLWNPETFNQSTSVNWGITPDQNDRMSLLTGLVSSNSTIDFTLRIDRTNDFACAKSYNLIEKYQDDIFKRAGVRGISPDTLANFYAEGKAPNSDADFAANIDDKITDLLRRGTEADLEFLYRTINGDGYSTSWGTFTSNINFLLPTIIRLDLGPQKLVGMVQSVNVTHLAFTREMIPIRTDVALSIDLRTAIGLTTSNFGANPDEVKTATGTK